MGLGVQVLFFLGGMRGGVKVLGRALGLGFWGA